jgi:hypothetical protein
MKETKHNRAKNKRDSEIRFMIFEEFFCFLFCCKDRYEVRDDFINYYNINNTRYYI